MGGEMKPRSDEWPERQATWPVPRWTEPAIRALGLSGRLNSVGKWASNAFYRMVKTGKVKDVLAGTWMAHPMHPMLTDLTIGAWTSASLLDVLGGEKARPGADMLAGAGILAAIPTAVSGLSDLTDIVDDQQRSIATAHALANIGALALWILSYTARKTRNRRVGMALSIAGTGVMTGAGFLGGHLSFREGVGVDHTAFEQRFEDWTEVMDERELKEGRPRRVLVSGTNVFLLRTGERIYALANRCSHRGGPLHKGAVDEFSVKCPWHLSIFRLEDGAVIQGPATAPQPAYLVRVQDGNIEIRERALS
jgi:nitrite reductase/ring-hydroxylating ferredoxin subunit/uncharacterized membrane protein